MLLALALPLAAGLCFGKRKSPLAEGNRLYDQNKFAQAVAAYDRAAGRDARDPRVFFDRALANEMVNRANAIADWKQFLSLAGADAEWSTQVKLIQERLKELERMPPPPEMLSPSHYNPKDNDYFAGVAGRSPGGRWTRWPVRVFLSHPPADWQEPVHTALEDWGRVCPLQQVDKAQEADVTVKWGPVDNPLEPTGSTEETEESTMKGETVVVRRQHVVMTLDNSHRLSSAEMLSAALHQFGHALGIRGHSGRISDVMFPQSQHVYSEQKGLESPDQSRHAPSGVLDRSITVTKISQRDINTLIRLYNSPGPLLTLD